MSKILLIFQESYQNLLKIELVGQTKDDFDNFDADGDGVITWSEWKSFQNLKSKFPNKGVPELQALLKKSADSDEKSPKLDPRQYKLRKWGTPCNVIYKYMMH